MAVSRKLWHANSDVSALKMARLARYRCGERVVAPKVARTLAVTHDIVCYSENASDFEEKGKNGDEIKSARAEQNLARKISTFPKF